MGRAALSHALGQVVHHDPFGQTELLRPAPTRPARASRSRRGARRPCLQSRRFQGSGQGILAERPVAVLPEALLPQLGGPVSRGPPAIGELLGGRCAWRRTRRSLRGRRPPAQPPPHRRRRTRPRSSAVRPAGPQRPPGPCRRPGAPQLESPYPSAGRRRSHRPPRPRAAAGRLQSQLRWSCPGRRAPRWRTTPFQGCDQGRSVERGEPPRPRGWSCPRHGRPRPGFPCPRRCP